MLTLSPSERSELQHQAEADDARADSDRHARLILLLADGFTWAEIRHQLHCSDSYIARWSKRFSAERLAGLYARYAGRERYKVTDDLESRVLKWTRQRRPADGSRHWSSRKLAAELGGAISHTTVARIWSRHGITPHRPAVPVASLWTGREIMPHHLEGLAVADIRSPPTGVVDIVGLYLSPHQHAAVFRMDPAARAVAVAAAPLESPAPPGKAPEHRAQRHGLHHRDGIHALYTALKGGDDDVSAGRQTTAGFAAFLAAITIEQPIDREIRVIADNPTVGKAQTLAALMADHPNLHLLIAPDYASWLGLMEHSLTEIAELKAAAHNKPIRQHDQQLMRYLRRDSQRTRSIKWKPDPTRQEGPG